MSLTEELKDTNSFIYKWFEDRYGETSEKFIKNHNKMLAQKSTITPRNKIKDFSILGTAFVYAFRWETNILINNFKQTLASLYCPDEIFKKLLDVSTARDKAISCLIFAAFEYKYRSGKKHELLSLLDYDNNKILPFPFENWKGTIEDLEVLIGSIKKIWIPNLHTENFKTKVYLNATFNNSSQINADAQQIVDGNLIKCFTTLKKEPMTKQHLWQQLSYVLLDSNNLYNISSVCWYYPRKSTIITYECDKLFKNLEQTRLDFCDLFDEPDWDETDSVWS